MARPFDWIETKNHDQLAWIDAYVARRASTGGMPVSLIQSLSSHSHGTVVEKLKAPNEDAEIREVSRQMKGAWQTHLYRKKHGNPVSLQMPNDTLKKLNALAKKRGQTQGDTLSQIITDAMNDQKFATAQGSKERELLKAKLKKQQETAHQAEQFYKDVVNRLRDALPVEIRQRFCFEAIVGELSSSLMVHVDKKKNNDSVEKGVSALEPVAPKTKVESSNIGATLEKLMQESPEQNGH
ncbi:hypothetical protein E0L35_16265 [Halomonas sp. ATBC28]|uniref:hypothetical protein n=1 Tax=Halomonas sp. ATBC28 TaxID=2545264 RepID=UPI00110F1C05|nr:hypothetical protein [Halomonas sp. ATBC28]TMU20376.1 hypothetical protein E0L35_16265 [Halomonas sp. ATBC28]